MIRTLIVDDQKLFADSLQICLGAEGANELSIVGVATGGEEAVAMNRELSPDVVLMDVHMPGVDGVEATRLIHQESPEAKIVMLTTFDDDVYVQSAIANGAMGYILKNIDLSELIAAIRAVYAGSFLVSKAVRSKLGPQRRSPGSGRADSLMAGFPDLTRREAEVLVLVMDSYDNHEIADRLGIAEQTVKNYISAIYAKLGVRDRIHAVRHVQQSLRSPST